MFDIECPYKCSYFLLLQSGVRNRDIGPEKDIATTLHVLLRYNCTVIRKCIVKQPIKSH